MDLLQLNALGGVFQKFGNAVLSESSDQLTGATVNKIQTVITNKKIETDFYRCGDIASHFDNKGLDEFGQTVLTVFSKENLLELYHKLKKEKGYDYRTFLETGLRKICEKYEIDAENFIELFISLFLDRIYWADRFLYDEIFQGDWREENRSDFDLSHKNEEQTIALLHEIRDAVGNSAQSESVIAQQAENNYKVTEVGCVVNRLSQKINDAVQQTNNWKPKYPDYNDIYWNNETKMREAMERLTVHWRTEREAAPNWFIFSYYKRSLLRTYTLHEDLMYVFKSAPALKRFAFAYEIVWRYEKSFSSYDINFVKAIEDVYDTFDEKIIPEAPEENLPLLYSQWFFIGLFLLREYREELIIDKWNSVYRTLKSRAEFYPEADARLSLEYIKFLFMQMKISDACNEISSFQSDKISYEMRLQIAGIRAECGQFKRAAEDLSHLETDLLSAFRMNDCDVVYIGSVLSVTYFLQAFVYESQNQLERDGELQSIWEKQKQFEPLFDYDVERLRFVREFSGSLKKEYEDEPFEIGREKRTIVYGGHQYKEVYDFYRLLEQMGTPLQIGYLRLLDDNECAFLKILLRHFRYIGWSVLLRMGGTKTAESVLTRKEILRLSQMSDGRLSSAFTYVYDALNRVIDFVHSSLGKHTGDAYSHILSNGLCVLQRLSSMADKEQQKKLITMMCKLMETDILSDSRVLNRWISYIMSVTDEHVKAECLNALLHSSSRERKHMSHEIDLDPFDVFSTNDNAKSIYKKAYIAPKTIEEMFQTAQRDEPSKMHIIPRLEQLHYFGLLPKEFNDRFSELLWDDAEGDALPLGKGYYPDFFLKCPHPDNVDVEGRIRRHLLNSDKFNAIRERRLSSMNFGDYTLWDEVRHLNKYRNDFWSLEEISRFMTEFIRYWDTVKNAYIEAAHPEFYESEFEARTKGLIRTITSFNRFLVLKIETDILDRLRSMAVEIAEMGVAQMQLLVFVTQDDQLALLEERLLQGLRSPIQDIADDSVCASEQILLECKSSQTVQKILHEIMILCLYRKEPGLRLCLNALYNVLYKNKDIELSDSDMSLLKEVLHTLAMQTQYQDNQWISEKETKKNVLTRVCCAGLAFRIYLYEDRRNLKHSVAVLEWKDICVGEKSLMEFSEVRKCWLE